MQKESQSGINELIAVIDKFASDRVLVIGDVMLDLYYYGTLLPTNPEGPYPNIDVQRIESALGGAANAARNMKALGATTGIIGVRGDDYAGHELQDMILKLFSDEPSNSQYLAIDPSRRTTIKQRTIIEDQGSREQQYHGRNNIESRHDISEATAELILEHALPLLKQGTFKGVYLSDYQKGMFTPHLTSELLRTARKLSIPVMVDPKPDHANLYKGATIIKVNWKEAREILEADAHPLQDPGEDMSDSARIDTLAHIGARELQHRFSCKTAILTFGKHGAFVANGNEKTFWNPAYARAMRGQAGAGDTFGATYFLSHLAGASAQQCAMIASFASACAVEQPGTSSITKNALAEYIRNYRPQ